MACQNGSNTSMDIATEANVIGTWYQDDIGIEGQNGPGRVDTKHFFIFNKDKSYITKHDLTWILKDSTYHFGDGGVCMIGTWRLVGDTLKTALEMHVNKGDTIKPDHKLEEALQIIYINKDSMVILPSNSKGYAILYRSKEEENVQ